jgi:hypothetical protein
MRKTSGQVSRSWRFVLLGVLTMLAAVLPAGADPTLIYSTYLGGSRGDAGFAVAVSGGFTFIAGGTRSLDYPIVGVSSSKPSGDEVTRDGFVTRLASSGAPGGVPTGYSRYVQGGHNDNSVVGIGVGPDGSAYVATLTFFGADTEMTLTKLQHWGAVAWTSGGFLGRTYPSDMAVDSQGNVYITGRNNSETQDGYLDEAFVWKIGSDGSTVYRTRIDGNNFESGAGIAVDAGGNAYVTGQTLSTNLPMAIQAVPVGSENAFVTKLDPAGTILWSTYLGGSGSDQGREIEVAADGTVVVAGTTASPDFPTLNAIQTELRGPQDLFVARLRSWGSRISSTYLGGTGTDEVRDLALEPSSILLAAVSPGADSPLREPLHPACGNSFVSKLDATASRVLDAACLGHSTISGVAADSSGISVTGTAASDLPLVNAWQPSPGGEAEAFAAKLKLNHPPDCSAATPSPSKLEPANGQFVPVSIHGITDPEGDSFTIAMISIFQDEWFTHSGMADATGLGTATANLRASRLNGGNGRVYHLTFTATDARGDACTATVKVCVPATQGGNCIDGGPRVESTRVY